MEVHAHTHTERKRFTHYLWEFIMLFLAVFCGFLAENIREHVVEKKREKQYMRSFVEDLETDTTEYNNRISNCNQTIRYSDSTILLLNRPDKDKWANDIYYFLRQIHRSSEFSTNDRTIIQLRNAGGMRLISDKSVSDSIVDYYKMVEDLKYIFEEQIDHKRSLRSHFSQLLNGIDYGKVANDENYLIRPDELLKLRITDPNVINTRTVILQNIKGINQGIRRRMMQMKKKSMVVRNFILKHYHLQ